MLWIKFVRKSLRASLWGGFGDFSGRSDIGREFGLDRLECHEFDLLGIGESGLEVGHELLGGSGNLLEDGGNLLIGIGEEAEGRASRVGIQSAADSISGNR